MYGRMRYMLLPFTLPISRLLAHRTFFYLLAVEILPSLYFAIIPPHHQRTMLSFS